MKNKVENFDFIKIKSELICYGIKHNKCSDDIYDIEHRTSVRRTSNMGLQLLLNDHIIVSIPYDNRNKKSKYYLFTENNKIYLTDDEKTVEVKILHNCAPSWYDYKLGNGKNISEYIQKEGKDVLICSVSNSCCYFSKSEQCAFCALNRGADIHETGRIKTISEAFKVILQKDQSIQSINLTGGNLYTKDRGLSQYIDILQAIRSVSDVPIAVEISPPEDLEALKLLKKNGATAIELNIEIWDEEIRSKMMPGKSKITREHYIEAWKQSMQLFGEGNVGSGIIIGLENPESSLDGIKAMIEVGCLPSILPFKPTDGSALETFHNCKPEELMKVTEKAVELLKHKKLTPIHGPGCIGCGACTLESDLYNHNSYKV